MLPLKPPEWAILGGIETHEAPEEEAEEVLERTRVPKYETPEYWEREIQEILGPDPLRPLKPPEWTRYAKPVDEDVPREEEISSHRAYTVLSPKEFEETLFSNRDKYRETEYDWFGGRLERGVEKIPFAGKGIAAARLWGAATAAYDLEQGELTEWGAERLGAYFAELDRQGDLSEVEEAVELGLEMLPFFAEMYVTGGTFTAASRSANIAMLKALSRIGNQYLKKKLARGVVSKMARRSVALGVGTAVLTSINPQFVARSTSERAVDLALKGEEHAFLKAMSEGPLAASFELGSEMTGGIGVTRFVKFLSRKAGVDHMMKAATMRWLRKNPRSKLANFLEYKRKVGWHGILEEIEEERLVDVANGLAGLDEKYGTTGRVFSALTDIEFGKGAASIKEIDAAIANPETSEQDRLNLQKRRKALLAEHAGAFRQLKVEAMAFGTIGLAGFGVQAARFTARKELIDYVDQFSKKPSRTNWKKLKKSHDKIEEKGGPGSSIPLPLGQTVLIPKTKEGDLARSEEETSEVERVEFDPDEGLHRAYLGMRLGEMVEEQDERLRRELDDMLQREREGKPQLTEEDEAKELQAEVEAEVEAEAEAEPAAEPVTAEPAAEEEPAGPRGKWTLTETARTPAEQLTVGEIQDEIGVLEEQWDSAIGKAGRSVFGTRRIVMSFAEGWLDPVKKRLEELRAELEARQKGESAEPVEAPVAEPPAAAEPAAAEPPPPPPAAAEPAAAEPAAEGVAAAEAPVAEEPTQTEVDRLTGEINGLQARIRKIEANWGNDWTRVEKRVNNGKGSEEEKADVEEVRRLEAERLELAKQRQAVEAAEVPVEVEAEPVEVDEPAEVPEAAAEEEGDPRLAELFEEEFEQALKEQPPAPPGRKTKVPRDKWLKKFLARGELKDEMPGLSEKGERIFDEKKLTPFPAAKLVSSAWRRASSARKKEVEDKEFSEKQYKEQLEFELEVGITDGTQVRWTDPETNEYGYGTVKRVEQPPQLHPTAFRRSHPLGWDLRVQTRDGEEFTIFENKKPTAALEQIGLEPYTFDRPSQQRLFAEEPAPEAAEGPGTAAYHEWKNPRVGVGEKNTSYLTGVSNAEIREAAKEEPGLGLLVTPKTGHFVNKNNKPEVYSHIAVDNGAFQKEGFKEGPFYKLLEKIQKKPEVVERTIFVVAPDVVEDWSGTLELFKEHGQRIRDMGFPVALVAQDGMDPETIPWGEFDVLAIGGSDAFKLGPDLQPVFDEAIGRGVHVHMLRVNSAERMRYAYWSGVGSVDGTTILRGKKNENLPKVRDWLAKEARGEHLDDIDPADDPWYDQYDPKTWKDEKSYDEWVKRVESFDRRFRSGRKPTPAPEEPAAPEAAVAEEQVDTTDHESVGLLQLLDTLARGGYSTEVSVEDSRESRAQFMRVAGDAGFLEHDSSVEDEPGWNDWSRFESASGFHAWYVFEYGSVFSQLRGSAAVIKHAQTGRKRLGELVGFHPMDKADQPLLDSPFSSIFVDETHPSRIRYEHRMKLKGQLPKELKSLVGDAKRFTFKRFEEENGARHWRVKKATGLSLQNFWRQVKHGPTGKAIPPVPIPEQPAAPEADPEATQAAEEEKEWAESAEKKGIDLQKQPPAEASQSTEGYMSHTWGEEVDRLSKKYFDGRTIDEVSTEELERSVRMPELLKGEKFTEKNHMRDGGWRAYPPSYFKEQKDENLFTKWLNLDRERIEDPPLSAPQDVHTIPQVWQLGREKARDWYDLWYARDMIWQELGERTDGTLEERSEEEFQPSSSDEHNPWGWLPGELQVMGSGMSWFGWIERKLR